MRFSNRLAPGLLMLGAALIGCGPGGSRDGPGQADKKTSAQGNQENQTVADSQITLEVPSMV